MNLPAGTSRRKRIAAGPKRPRYLADRDLDRMMIMFVALMGEMSALRDRLDTHEALAEEGQLCRSDAVERFHSSEARSLQRENMRSASVRRVFRVLMEELENGPSSAGLDDPRADVRTPSD